MCLTDEQKEYYQKIWNEMDHEQVGDHQEGLKDLLQESEESRKKATSLLLDSDPSEEKDSNSK